MRTYAAISNILIQPVRHYGVIWRPTIEKQRIVDSHGNISFVPEDITALRKPIQRQQQQPGSHSGN